MRSLPCIGASLLLLASCGSPPKPPAVDDSKRRPANTAQAIDLQRCQIDLLNAQIRAKEAAWTPEAAAVTKERFSALQQAISALQPANDPGRVPPSPAANAVYTLTFEYGKTAVHPPPEIESRLLAEAKVAPLILLRGRTDGDSDTPAESRIASMRAAAVRDYLVAAGVSPARIRATYQPVGDYVADNRSAEGRRLNRRVEVEIYRSVPVLASAPPATGALDATDRSTGMASAGAPTTVEAERQTTSSE